ncbi:MAG: BrnT family toxin [Bryobacteraceae bacterium]
MGSDLQFDWDDANTGHLRRHRVTRNEFEELLRNEPLDLDYETETGEERYKSLGATLGGRILVAIWTVRRGRVRAITAYPATMGLRTLYLQQQHRGER